MSEKKQKRKPDERIIKESNHLAGKMFYVMCVLLAVSLVVKCLFNLPWYVYALEIVSLTAGVVCFLFKEINYGILFVKEKDAALTELHDTALAKAMMVQFWLMTIGECIPILLCAYIEPLLPYFWWFASYMLILLPVCLIITIYSLKRGWLVWGSKKQEKTGKKHFAVRVAIGGLVYGLLMELFNGFEHVYHDGAFHPEGLWWIVGMGAAWGILFYFAMLAVIKVSEKRADKRLQEADSEKNEEMVVNEK